MTALPVLLSQVTNYSHNETAEPLNQEETPKPDRIERLRQCFSLNGPVESVRAIILASSHKHPVVFLLEGKDSRYALPGGKLKTDEGLNRLLSRKMPIVDGGTYEVTNELIASWYRPQFSEMVLPFVPSHVSEPKEIERWHLVIVPPRARFEIPDKYRLHMVSFYDIQEDIEKFGDQLGQIPMLMSRFKFET